MTEQQVTERIEAQLEQAGQRIRFGPRPTDHIPHVWAARMLTYWRSTSPAAFGRALAKAALDDSEQQ